jgi:hypothetical protein
VLKLLQLLERGPFAFVPKGFLLQPIDVWEVASRLVELALSVPARHVPDVGGPEIRTFGSCSSSLEVSGRRRRVVEVPLPGRRRERFPRGAPVSRPEVWRDHVGRVSVPDGISGDEPIREEEFLWTVKLTVVALIANLSLCRSTTDRSS